MREDGGRMLIVWSVLVAVMMTVLAAFAWPVLLMRSTIDVAAARVDHASLDRRVAAHVGRQTRAP